MNVSPAQCDASGTIGGEIVAPGWQLHTIGEPSIADSAVARTRMHQARDAEREQGSQEFTRMAVQLTKEAFHEVIPFTHPDIREKLCKFRLVMSK
jgi:hypothetical protein